MSITITHDYVKLITPGVSANRSEFFSIAFVDTNQTKSITFLFTTIISQSKKRLAKRQQKIIRKNNKTNSR